MTTKKQITDALYWGREIFKAMYDDGKSEIDLKHTKKFAKLYAALQAEPNGNAVFLTKSEAKVLTLACDEANGMGDLDASHLDSRQRKLYKIARAKLAKAAGERQ